jgi:hypothetical protein
VLAAAGRGLDTHRVYEALLMGCIPVVRHSAAALCAYQHLPVLILDRWAELTVERLVTGYARLVSSSSGGQSGNLHSAWQWQRLFAPYWTRRIEKTRMDFLHYEDDDDSESAAAVPMTGHP